MRYQMPTISKKLLVNCTVFQKDSKRLVSKPNTKVTPNSTTSTTMMMLVS